MPVTSATACGKLILLGEHAVVYDSPAIAIPLTSLRVRALVEPAIGQPQGTIRIKADSLSLNHNLSDLGKEHFLVSALGLLFSSLNLQQHPTCRVTITSELPIAAGLGSSAAYVIAILRAMSAFLGHPLKPEDLNALAYQSEQLVHGRPSGIDNTVVTYERPIFYKRGSQLEFLDPECEMRFVIADSGVRKSTRDSTAQLANDLATDPTTFQPHLDAVCELVQQGKLAFQTGDLYSLGQAINTNHEHLVAMRLSCPELDRLVLAARQAGALGAKLTGGGMGGHMLALVRPDTEAQVMRALEDAGSTRVLSSRLPQAE